MRVSAMNFEGRQQLITESPTLPDHIATKQYVDQTVPALVTAAIGNSLNTMEDTLTDQIDAVQASVNDQIAALQSAMTPPSAVSLGAGEPADLAIGDYFVLTANGNQTITLTNTEALGGKPKVIVFDIRNTSTLNLTWNVPGLTFSRGAPVGLTPNGRDFIALVTSDGGANWTLVLAAPDVRAA